MSDADTFDLEKFRTPEQIDLDSLQKQTKKPPRHRQGEKFLMGPIPWAWLERAAKLKGKALHVALLLWMESGCRKNRSVRFNLSAEKFNLSTDTARRALRTLETAKLVTIMHHPGQSLEVTLLEAKSPE
jgi:hypothetical protein